MFFLLFCGLGVFNILLYGIGKNVQNGQMEPEVVRGYDER